MKPSEANVELSEERDADRPNRQIRQQLNAIDDDSGCDEDVDEEQVEDEPFPHRENVTENAAWDKPRHN